jgi:hypothetical protein
VKTLSMETAEVRQAMLDSLGDPLSPACSGLRSRIQGANDLQNLWHLRGDLMQALALMRGESRAADELGQITRLFETGLPQGLARGLQRANGRV